MLIKDYNASHRNIIVGIRLSVADTANKILSYIDSGNNFSYPSSEFSKFLSDENIEEHPEEINEAIAILEDSKLISDESPEERLANLRVSAEYLINADIKGEIDAIDLYMEHAQRLKEFYYETKDTNYLVIAKLEEDIANEECVHRGELEAALTKLNADYALKFNKGVKEATEKLSENKEDINDIGTIYINRNKQ